MVESPERIWAFHVRASGIELGEWVEDPSDTASGTEYVRSDCHKALERQIAELREEVRQQEIALRGAVLANARCRADREAAEAREARLSEALRPFAEAELDEADEDRWHIWEHPSALNISVADLREARAALSGSGSGWRTKAADDVLAERRRQVETEGWTPEHDNVHLDGQIAAAAACYALGSDGVNYVERLGKHGHIHRRRNIWPWGREWWKPSSDRRNLVKAGALILAEIERLDRLPAAPQPTGGE